MLELESVQRGRGKRETKRNERRLTREQRDNTLLDSRLYRNHRRAEMRSDVRRQVECNRCLAKSGSEEDQQNSSEIEKRREYIQRRQAQPIELRGEDESFDVLR